MTRSDRPGSSDWSRRRFLTSAALLSTGALSCRSQPGEPASALPASSLGERATVELTEELQSLLEANAVPGFAAGLIRDSTLIWSGGFGYADIDQNVPMSPDTLLNIGSVTKTVTTTAILQLIEQSRLTLDDDVQKHVSFPVRNPRFPDIAITIRQLLTHRSSILDGDAYDESYACGDRTEALGDWLAEYFATTRTDEGLRSHFHLWRPGELEPPEQPRAYSNVAFGLLGHVIETTSGLSYEDYLHQYILEPLGMASSGIRIDHIDASRHAVPYSRIGDDFPVDPSDDDFEKKTLARYSAEERPPLSGGLHPHCLYSFATPPDGLLRTSVNELALFLLAWIGKGMHTSDEQGAIRILTTETVEDALSQHHFGRALCWVKSSSAPGEPLWMHSGGDPGIATLIGFRPEEKSGLILMFNVDDPGEMFRPAVDVLLGAL